MDKDCSDISNSKIKFLMIQRKHSLGYLEFLRGRYDLNNIESIVFLLEQMTPNELIDLSIKEFDYLWNMLWDNEPILQLVLKINFIIKNIFHQNKNFMK